MNSLRIWQRLLWKECRESWPLVAIGLLIPLGLPLLRKGELINPFGDSFGVSIGPVDILVALVTILVVLWAVDRVHGKGFGSAQTRFLLPATPIMRWVTAYMMPLAVPLVTGASLGYVVSLTKELPQTTPHDFRLAVLFFMLAIFAVSTTLTQVISPIPAILTGIGLLFVTFDVLTLPRNIGLFAGMIAVSILVSLVYEAGVLLRNQKTGRIAGVITLAGLLVVPLVGGAFPTLTNVGNWIPSHEYRSADYDRERFSFGPGPWGIEQLTYTDKPQQVKYTLQPGMPTLPLEILGDGRVLLAQQRPQEKDAFLVLWDPKRGTTKQAAQLPVGRWGIGKLCHTSLDPRGRYVAMLFQSRIGLGFDLWMVDLQPECLQLKACSHLVLANADMEVLDRYAPWGYQRKFMVWQQDRLFIETGHAPYAVDLARMRAEALTVSAGRSGAR